MTNWNEARLQQYIDNEIEENHRLYYKVARLIQSNHTAAFWYEIEKVMLNYVEYQN